MLRCAHHRRLCAALRAAGGRVRTDVHEGFLLDRGFQIFLTGYPEAQARATLFPPFSCLFACSLRCRRRQTCGRCCAHNPTPAAAAADRRNLGQEVLDYGALDLQGFYAGADVRWGGAFHRVADPLRHFVDGLLSLTNPIGSPVDKVRVGVFRLLSTLGPLDALLARPETSTEDRLRVCPFFWGVPRGLGCTPPPLTPRPSAGRRFRPHACTQTSTQLPSSIP